jgi:hypothetical protein
LRRDDEVADPERKEKRVSELLMIRPVRFLPGKASEGLEWSRSIEPIRRRFGLKSQFMAKGIIDPTQYVLVQTWECQEAYERYKASAERAELVIQARRLYVFDPSALYEIV